MSDSWQYVGSQLAIEFFNGCKSQKRRRLLLALNRLAAEPYLEPHAVSIDSTGRTISIIFLNGFEITYWIDHFVKEVRVIEISALS